MSEEDKARNRGVVERRHHQQQQPPQYGTFQGVANYPPPPPPHHQPVIGFPQPAPPPGATEPSAPPPPQDPSYYAHGYQTVTGYAVAEGRPVRERRLPCCGIGVGWFLFIIGFFLGAIPWYIGLFVLLCARIDPREKPGYIACTIAAVVATVAIILGATKGADAW
ncbi:60S ribosomal protein L18a-like protein [Hevea brasiliensis]|uniref:60S ribosomal protein L18a-like protein n=1 Tax=Hevea brasiliensis TaxID=3981 RepID=UPI0025F6BE1E|nr:60S ribosomal protein L18a-like protein [Hevea brasiliensis]